mgnify:FL=1
MKGKIISKRIRYGVYIVSILLVVVATYFLLPKDDDFNRYFEVGKPWAYDELMAPKDFAVYKSDNQLESERSLALRELEPYMNREEREVRLEGVKVSSRESDWIADRLREIYAVGVISLQDRQELERFGVSSVVLLEGHSVVAKTDMKQLFTPKTAYDYVVEKANSVGWIDNNLLQTANIGDYIKPNVEIDRTKTDDAIKIIVDGVMLTSGMVQKGEKIIDKGEVITEEKYQILKLL